MRRNVTVLSARKPRKRPFDLSSEEEENDDTGEAVGIASDNLVEVPPVDEMPVPNGDDSMQPLQEDESILPEEVPADSTLPEEVAVLQETPQKRTYKKRGRPKKKVEASTQIAALTPENLEKTSRELKAASDKTRPTESSDPEEGMKPKKGRPAKSKTEVYRDLDEVVEEGPSKPTKRPKLTSKSDTSSTNRRRPPPSQRDPNATITSLQGGDRGVSKERNPQEDEIPIRAKGRRMGKGKENTPLASPPPLPRPAPSDRGRPKPRSLMVLRSETPSEDVGTRYTRSGRTSVKPLAYWRNEKIIYGNTRLDGSRLSLAGIKEVVRGEEIEDPRPPRKRPGPKKRPGNRRHHHVEEVEETDEDMEEWEEDPGALEAEVLQWDPLTQRAIEDAHEQVGSWSPLFPLLSIIHNHHPPILPPSTAQAQAPTSATGTNRQPTRHRASNRAQGPRDTGQGGQEPELPLRQDHHPPLLPLGHGGHSGARREAAEELAQEPHGVLGLCGAGGGGRERERV